MVSMTNCLTSMFAGIVVFSIIGFKATMVHEKCLSARNATIMELFGSNFTEGYLPAEGAVFNVTRMNGSIGNAVMPFLPECDLQKELDNVSNFLLLIF